MLELGCKVECYYCKTKIYNQNQTFGKDYPWQNRDETTDISFVLIDIKCFPKISQIN